MPLEEKNEKKSAKRAPSDPPIALFDTKHVFWNCEKEVIPKAEKIYSPSVHATRTPSDQPKSLIENQVVQESPSVAGNGAGGGGGGGCAGLIVSSHKQQQPQQFSPESSKQTAIVSTATETKVVDQGGKSNKSTSSHNQQILKLVPSRFSSTQLLKSRKGSLDSISSSRRPPKTTVSLCLKPSSPEGGTSSAETLPQSVQDVVKAFLGKQSKQYTFKE